MANLEEIVSRKTENDSQWKARQQADRENLMALQDAADTINRLKPKQE